MRFTALRTLFGSDPKTSVARRGKVRRFRPNFDLLEDRRLLAILWVDDSGGQPFTTITAAEAAANPGDTIKVAPGTYEEAVSVDVARLTIIGGQPTAPGDVGPSIVESDTFGFSLLANGITIKNFTIQPDTVGTGVDGIITSSNFSGYKILNNTIHDFEDGVHLNTSLTSPAPTWGYSWSSSWGSWGSWGSYGSTGPSPTLVNGNRFTTGLTNGVHSDVGLRNATISNNNFKGISDASVKIGVGTTLQSSNVQILNNQITDPAPILVTNLTNSKINGNAIIDPVTVDPGLIAAIFLGGGVTKTEVSHNSIIAGGNTSLALDGIRLGLYDAATNSAPNNDNTISWNTILGTGDPSNNFDDGIVLDGAGANGAVLNGTGVSAANRNKVYHNTIQNMDDEGINLINGARKNSVTYNTTMLNGSDGIQLRDSHENTIACNTSNNNEDDGINLRNSNLNTISGNTTNFNGDTGIEIDPSNQNKILSNKASFNGTTGIYVNGNWNTISCNTASFNGLGVTSSIAGGIVLDDANNNKVTYNTANNNSGSGIQLQAGGGTASNNQISYNNVKNNTLNGIHLIGAGTTSGTGNTVSWNCAYNNGIDGIRLEDSDWNTVTKNTANHNGNDGIHLVSGIGDGSDNNTISYNTANDNQNHGIDLDSDSADNLVTRNTAINNASFDLADDSIGGGTAGTANTWTNNIANSRDPAGLG